MGHLFGGVPSQDFEKAKVVLIPVPYDATTTYRPGARDGPDAIFDASRQLDEFWGEDRWHPMAEQGFIYTLEETYPRGGSTLQHLNSVMQTIIVEVVSRDKIPFMLGGDHSLSYSAVFAVHTRYQDFSILHFDAHPDLRNSYQGNLYSHACVMRRCYELSDVSLTSVGIRSIDCDTADYIADTVLKNTPRKSLNLFYADQIRRHGVPFGEILSMLKPKVYITIDLDAFDPSIMPAVGTPQPAGLGWEHVIDLLSMVFKYRTVIGMDVVELAPIPGIVYPNVTAAKLVWHMLEMFYTSGQQEVIA